MGTAGPERLTRADLAVIAVFAAVLVAGLLVLPLHGLAHVGAALGIAIVAAVLTGLIAYRGMHRGS